MGGASGRYAPSSPSHPEEQSHRDLTHGVGQN